MKKTINVVKALLVLCDKAKNIGVGFYVLLTFNNTFVFLSCLPSAFCMIFFLKACFNMPLRD